MLASLSHAHLRFGPQEVLKDVTWGLEPGQSRLICLDVEGFPLESHWRFVYPVGKQLSPAARAFLDFARADAKNLLREVLS